MAQWARRLRTRFQLGLVGWISGERVEQNLEILSRTAEKLEQVATTQPVFQLWWVVGAMLEALREGGLETGASIKRLLGLADREMQRLYEQGEGRYAERRRSSCSTICCITSRVRAATVRGSRRCAPRSA